ncbi:hypothetical protein [Streptomyces sp. V1I1]|uniref:hypothetical protein n=1 Tax=Streptomyces sp. V1I1 TaxID=3042272 RepID=UPI0027D929D1|nr:hypothetical protein [Streptomyces sp. V1I1]
MFTGYYKFRERSYFLQQTADAIEEEANASVPCLRTLIQMFSSALVSGASEAKCFSHQASSESRRSSRKISKPSNASRT